MANSRVDGIARKNALTIVVSENPALPVGMKLTNAMRTSKVIGPQPDEVDQMRCIDIHEDLRKAQVCAKKIGRFHLIPKGIIM